ncbi:hypothetical protein LTY59_07070 [Limosilactobacillus balticus]|uniref:Uncharacterized protein n=1 Tax=Limosilactobacillus balticus TaxID=2759747 RepID=A0ABS8REU2_9LACO|nr:hypothetical protein [Limosilactobacillus balticus]MBB1109483.1 hypothetical protein [Limosilactobacillus balticus]MCD7138980.1 hypothetical protein [Limosilactobacillus balticus]
MSSNKNKFSYEMAYISLDGKYIYINDKYKMLKGGQGVEKRPNKIKENEINGTNNK